MKGLKHRNRYKRGLTDYHHRRKMLTNYENYVRLRLGRKNKYYFAALYETLTTDKPDICSNYKESRWISNTNQDPTVQLNSNQKSAYIFGAIYANSINQMPLSKHLILDLSRSKAMQYLSFMRGLFSNLNEDKKKLMRFEFKEDDVLPPKYESINLTDYVFRKKRKGPSRTN